MFINTLITNSSHIFPIFVEIILQTLLSFEHKIVTAANEAKSNTYTFHDSSVG